MSKFKDFLNKASKVAPEVLNVAGKVLTGNIGGAVSEVGNILKAKGENDAKAQELYLEFQMHEKDFEKELYALEIEDRKSARSREVEIARIGKTDVLLYATGFTGLFSFIALVITVLLGKAPDNAIFHQLIGLVEGVALTIFSYYFGTSKGSADKTKMLNEKGKS